jgi:hypothetical protein
MYVHQLNAIMDNQIRILPMNEAHLIIENSCNEAFQQKNDA